MQSDRQAAAIDLAGLSRLFLEELGIHVPALERGLEDMMSGTGARSVPALLMCVRSIKISARTCSLNNAFNLADSIEKALFLMKQERVDITFELLEHLQRAADLFSSLLLLDESEILEILENESEIINEYRTELESFLVANIRPAPVKEPEPVPPAGRNSGLPVLAGNRYLRKFSRELVKYSRDLEVSLACSGEAISGEKIRRLLLATGSIKGEAQILGIGKAAALAKSVEKLLMAAEDGKIYLTAERVDALIKTGAIFKEIAGFEAISTLETIGETFEKIDDYCDKLDSFLDGGSRPVERHEDDAAADGAAAAQALLPGTGAAISGRLGRPAANGHPLLPSSGFYVPPPLDTAKNVSRKESFDFSALTGLLSELTAVLRESAGNDDDIARILGMAGRAEMLAGAPVNFIAADGSSAGEALFEAVSRLKSETAAHLLAERERSSRAAGLAEAALCLLAEREASPGLTDYLVFCVGGVYFSIEAKLVLRVVNFGEYSVSSAGGREFICIGEGKEMDLLPFPRFVLTKKRANSLSCELVVCSCGGQEFAFEADHVAGVRKFPAGKGVSSFPFKPKARPKHGPGNPAHLDMATLFEEWQTAPEGLAPEGLFGRV